MGFLDDMKETAEKAADAVNDLADEHGDEAKKALDKAADVVDDKTGGKYTDKIETGVDKAGEAIDKMAADDK